VIDFTPRIVSLSRRRLFTLSKKKNPGKERVNSLGAKRVILELVIDFTPRIVSLSRRRLFTLVARNPGF
jgi:hypothetical protein